MAEEELGVDYWVGQVQKVMEQLDHIARKVEALDDKVDHYITDHDNWCAGLSVAVKGAAEVLQRIERYGASADGLDSLDGRGSRDTAPEAGPARNH